MALATPVGSIHLWAQGETTSAITGQVSDTSGGAVARATVTITHRGTGLRRQVQTDESGRFAFPQLHPGPYSMRKIILTIPGDFIPFPSLRLGS